MAASTRTWGQARGSSREKAEHPADRPARSSKGRLLARRGRAWGAMEGVRYVRETRGWTLDSAIAPPGQRGFPQGPEPDNTVLPLPSLPQTGVSSPMAVYTEVFDDDLRTFLADYDIGDLRALKGIAEGVENSNYLLLTDRASYILTLYERRVDPADLPYFLGLLRHLSERGLPCPLPVPGRDGEALRTLAGRPAAIVTFLQGAWPRRPDLSHCAQLGEALARLHQAGADYPLSRRNALSVAGWRTLVESTRARADEVMPGLQALLEDELAFLEAHWPQDLPGGVIHADLFPDNVFFLKGTLSGVIDFYFACNDAFAYDLAICLNAWCFEHEREFNFTKARALLNRYQAQRPLTPREIEVLPLLARGAALRFLLTRLYDGLNTPAGALVRPKDPAEYVHKLKFHQAVERAEAYGLDR
ncbi:Homoserine kinase [Pararhodospirillum photometricum DSM 122]|uniref:Homoserine kinase n=2 Tax=Pararhodospirillum photometricum TaxID=1084 RepID=H6SNH9_PARPM|nr:Homoserine kinase [Pararhodospirillum photometricum DSM 122]